MKRKIKIPLPDADQYYDLLIQNEKTKGTYEQKMLVLRRRFDRILRDVTGPFSSSSSFYKDSMATIKGELGISDEKWAEFDKMKDSFNTLMHRDVSVGKGRYMLCLQRMAPFPNANGKTTSFPFSTSSRHWAAALSILSVACPSVINTSQGCQ